MERNFQLSDLLIRWRDMFDVSLQLQRKIAVKEIQE